MKEHNEPILKSFLRIDVLFSIQDLNRFSIPLNINTLVGMVDIVDRLVYLSEAQYQSC